jgi:hypothetical protein
MRAENGAGAIVRPATGQTGKDLSRSGALALTAAQCPHPTRARHRFGHAIVLDRTGRTKKDGRVANAALAALAALAGACPSMLLASRFAPRPRIGLRARLLRLIG